MALVYCTVHRHSEDRDGDIDAGCSQLESDIDSHLDATQVTRPGCDHEGVVRLATIRWTRGKSERLWPCPLRGQTEHSEELLMS